LFFFIVSIYMKAMDLELHKLHQLNTIKREDN